MAVPEYSNELDFLTEKLFPINQSYGDIHDHAVQLCIKNAVTVFLEKRILKKLITSLNNLILFEKSLLLF